MQTLDALLKNYHTTDLDEQRFKEEMQFFFKNHLNCFERTNLTAHFTASCWLLSKDETKALLMHHKKYNIWTQLGGHCDGDTDVLSVSIKEAKEESGISSIVAVFPGIFDLDIHYLPTLHHEPAHIHYDIRFLLKVTSDEEYVVNRESLALRWLDVEDSDYPLSLDRMVKKWRAYLSQTRGSYSSSGLIPRNLNH